MELSFIKKILIVLIVSLVVFNFSGRLEPIQKTYAIPVVCANCSQVWADIAQWAKDAYQWSKEYIYPALRDAAIKRIMDQITDDTVKWIENGGEPRFVNDWNGLLDDSLSAAVGDVLLETKLAPLCSPFKVRLNFELIPQKTLSQRARCTIEDIGLNLEEFWQDFSKGNWIGYNESWQPQNNEFGIIMMATDEAIVKAKKKTEAKVNEAISGKGFMSVKRCLEYASEGPEVDAYDFCLTDAENSGRSSQEIQAMKDACSKTAGTQIPCVKEETITPGDAVGEAFRDTITSDSQWARSAQSALAAITNALINRVVKEGVGYVQGVDEREQQRQNNQQKQDEIEKKNYLQNIKPMLASISTIRKEWDYIRDIKQKSYDVINGANGILPTLNEMQSRNCQSPYSTNVAEINEMQSLLSSLNAEIADLENKIANVDEISLSLNDAVDGTDRERMISQQDAIDFDNKYNTSEMQQQIHYGTVRQAADEKLADLKAKLLDARNRLQLCIQAQTPNY